MQLKLCIKIYEISPKYPLESASGESNMELFWGVFWQTTGR